MERVSLELHMDTGRRRGQWRHLCGVGSRRFVRRRFVRRRIAVRRVAVEPIRGALGAAGSSRGIRFEQVGLFVRSGTEYRIGDRLGDRPAGRHADS